MKIVFCICMSMIFAFCDVLKVPYKTVELNANVLNVAFVNDNLYIATDDGLVMDYDIKNDKSTNILTLKKIKNFFNDNNNPKVLSIDELNGKVIVLAEGDFGDRIIYLVKNGIATKQKLQNQSIKKAYFLDDANVVLGSLSNELYFLSLNDNKIYKNTKLSTASMSDMKLSIDKKMLCVATEGGKVYFYDILKDKIINTLDIHKDKIYSIDFKENTLISGSVDKFAGVYKDGKIDKIKTEFLVYAVGLSPDSNIGAFVNGELNDVDIINTRNLSKITTLNTKQDAINDIIFISNNKLITTAYDKKLLFWRID
ncbi:nitrate reductase accessory protein [Campylobacter pinnipediorum subsp. caledonicus]|uniref:Nitrate reductase accessory protein n=1 Tax=Campylobacter pinnipediorum subsp. caledonicus TaxID=1874362 RepID=A0A1S6U6E6_9BACT|nr:hypothetical protein [Campylobacter pinnipediorum]AQW87283.1 nitrate reductase accessory protein [Campylobacter pinnipediorum subsp. caledonicus]